MFHLFSFLNSLRGWSFLTISFTFPYFSFLSYNLIPLPSLHFVTLNSDIICVLNFLHIFLISSRIFLTQIHSLEAQVRQFVYGVAQKRAKAGLPYAAGGPLLLDAAQAGTMEGDFESENALLRWERLEFPFTTSLLSWYTGSNQIKYQFLVHVCLILQSVPVEMNSLF